MVKGEDLQVSSFDNPINLIGLGYIATIHIRKLGKVIPE